VHVDNIPPGHPEESEIVAYLTHYAAIRKDGFIELFGYDDLYPLIKFKPNTGKPHGFAGNYYVYYDGTRIQAFNLLTDKLEEYEITEPPMVEIECQGTISTASEVDYYLGLDITAIPNFGACCNYHYPLADKKEKKYFPRLNFICDGDWLAHDPDDPDETNYTIVTSGNYIIVEFAKEIREVEIKSGEIYTLEMLPSEKGIFLFELKKTD
jgi:hypothetical protein